MGVHLVVFGRPGTSRGLLCKHSMTTLSSNHAYAIRFLQQARRTVTWVFGKAFFYFFHSLFGGSVKKGFSIFYDTPTLQVMVFITPFFD